MTEPDLTRKDTSFGQRPLRALRSALGSIGAHESWARTEDRTARTAPARQAFNDRFETAVDPDRLLSPEERAVRAGHARKAHMRRLALARWSKRDVA